MFFFGIFSTAAPLLLLLAFYLFGIVSMSFQQKKLDEEANKLQAKEIHVKEIMKTTDDKTFHFTDHFSQIASTEYNITSSKKVYPPVEDFSPPDFVDGNLSKYSCFYYNKPPPAA